jgi:ubiquinone/menaquinone biosynthesis C-methylase UbiE
MTTFKNAQESHAHSLRVLNDLYEHDDFMESVDSVIDLGCGHEALDLQWWATRTTRDDDPTPLNIRCTGVDLVDSLSSEAIIANITYLQNDLESLQQIKHGQDILWCHDVFQYMINPMQCLANWRRLCAKDGMLVLVVPQTTNIEFSRQAFDQPSGCYYNHTMVSLIHMLAVTGWDCSSGFFLKQPNDPWLHAIVYNSNQEPIEPRTTSWYHLAEKGLLPASAVECVNRYGYLRQHNLVLPWIDKSLSWMGHQ